MLCAIAAPDSHGLIKMKDVGRCACLLTPSSGLRIAPTSRQATQLAHAVTYYTYHWHEASGYNTPDMDVAVAVTFRGSQSCEV